MPNKQPAAKAANRSPPSSASSVIKVVLAGDAGVGKTLLAHRLAHPERQPAEEYESTVGVDFFSVPVTTRDGLRVTVQLWDTAGQERYRAMSTTTFRGAHAVIVMYDITDVATYNHVEDWVVAARSIAPKATIAVAGNKADLEHMRAVPHGYGTDIAKRLATTSLPKKGEATPVRHCDISSYTRAQLDGFIEDAVSDAADAIVANATEVAKLQHQESPTPVGASADATARKQGTASRAGGCGSC